MNIEDLRRRIRKGEFVKDAHLTREDRTKRKKLFGQRDVEPKPHPSASWDSLQGKPQYSLLQENLSRDVKTKPYISTLSHPAVQRLSPYEYQSAALRPSLHSLYSDELRSTQLTVQSALRSFSVDELERAQLTPLQSALQSLSSYERGSAKQSVRQYLPKAIEVCDALEKWFIASETERLTAPENGWVSPDRIAMVLRKMPWESFGDILGLDAAKVDRSRIEKIAMAVEKGDPETLRDLTSYNGAIEIVRNWREELKKELDSVPSNSDTSQPTRFSGLIKTVIRIGMTVLISAVAAGPLTAAIFNEPLLTAGIKAGINSLITSVAKESIDQGFRIINQNSPPVVLEKYHEQLIGSVEEYSRYSNASTGSYLTAENAENLVDRVIAKMKLQVDACLTYCTTIDLYGFDEDHKGYRETIEHMMDSIGQNKNPHEFNHWVRPLKDYAPIGQIENCRQLPVIPSAFSAFSKELEWNNKSTEADIIAGHRLDNASKWITYLIPATKFLKPWSDRNTGWPLRTDRSSPLSRRSATPTPTPTPTSAPARRNLSTWMRHR